MMGRKQEEEFSWNTLKVATFIVNKNNLRLSAVLLHVPVGMKMVICINYVPDNTQNMPIKLIAIVV